MLTFTEKTTEPPFREIEAVLTNNTCVENKAYSGGSHGSKELASVVISFTSPVQFCFEIISYIVGFS